MFPTREILGWDLMDRSKINKIKLNYTIECKPLECLPCGYPKQNQNWKLIKRIRFRSGCDCLMPVRKLTASCITGNTVIHSITTRTQRSHFQGLHKTNKKHIFIGVRLDFRWWLSMCVLFVSRNAEYDSPLPPPSHHHTRSASIAYLVCNRSWKSKQRTLSDRCNMHKICLGIDKSLLHNIFTLCMHETQIFHACTTQYDNSNANQILRAIPQRVTTPSYTIE